MAHDCVDTRRLELLEEDLRKLRETTNGKFDDFRKEITESLASVWKKLDCIAVVATGNKFDLKWIVLLLFLLLDVASRVVDRAIGG